MIHVQGQAGANWRRHADFTALTELRANPAHRPLNPFLASPISCVSACPASASSIRSGSPWRVHHVWPYFSYVPTESHTLVFVVWGREMATKDRIKQEQLQVEGQTQRV